MTMEQKIKAALNKSLNPEYMELINESHLHKGHGGDDGSGETHFKLIVVSDKFEGLSRIARHRLVYKAVNPLFSGSLHALKIKTYTDLEYKNTIRG